MRQAQRKLSLIALTDIDTDGYVSALGQGHGGAALDQRDEDFLRDLMWSEAWFPWRKKNSILVRGRDDNFWERFAVAVSTLALVATAISTYSSWRQVDIMKQQLVSDMLNEHVQSMLDLTLEHCTLMNNSPLPVDAGPGQCRYRDKYGKLYIDTCPKDMTPEMIGKIITPDKDPQPQSEQCYFRDRYGNRYVDQCPDEKEAARRRTEISSYFLKLHDQRRNIAIRMLNTARLLPKEDLGKFREFNTELGYLTPIQELNDLSYTEEVRQTLRFEASDCMNQYARLMNALAGASILDPFIGYSMTTYD